MATWNLRNKGEEEAVHSLATDSDRAVAIVAAAFLENRLEQELKNSLRHDEVGAKEAKWMMDTAGPLGAFAVKIRMGLLLRLFGKVVFREMMIIKDIRNEFAHVIGENAVRSFASPEIKDRCGHLKIIENYVRPMKDAPRLFPPENLPAEESKRRSSMSFSDNPGPRQILDNPRKRYTETCGLFAERFEGTGRFLIIGDEPEPFP